MDAGGQGIADRLDHVSIATRQIASMVPLIRDVLGARYLMGATEAAQGFRWAQFQFPGGGIIELIEPVGSVLFRTFFDIAAKACTISRCGSAISLRALASSTSSAGARSNRDTTTRSGKRCSFIRARRTGC